MGTRHLICVVKDGEYKVAQYGQWDGYPSGQGLIVLGFLTKEMDRTLFESKIDELSWITDDEHKAQWAECGADPDTDLVSIDIAEKHAEKHPENSRDTGGKILAVIQNSNKPLKLVNQLKFAGDSLFCEWAYVVDLDKNTLEVYTGFNKEPLKKDERFAQFDKESNSVELDGDTIIREREYHPVAFAKSFALNNLPSEEDFLAYFKNDEED